MPEKTPATQKFIEIEHIKDGVVYLKGGALRKVLIVSGVNFDLKSDAEQNLILASFQDFLNTIDFSVQLFIHSRKINIDAYLESMAKRKETEESELLKIQIEDYIDFIRSFVDQNAIISKSFFIIVPYDSGALPNSASGILSIFGVGRKKQITSAETEREAHNLEQLDYRVNQAIQGLGNVGLRSVPLNDDELLELFYNLYNPQLVEKRSAEVNKK